MKLIVRFRRRDALGAFQCWRNETHQVQGNSCRLNGSSSRVRPPDPSPQLVTTTLGFPPGVSAELRIRFEKKEKTHWPGWLTEKNTRCSSISSPLAMRRTFGVVDSFTASIRTFFLFFGGYQRVLPHCGVYISNGTKAHLWMKKKTSQPMDINVAQNLAPTRILAIKWNIINISD